MQLGTFKTFCSHALLVGNGYRALSRGRSHDKCILCAPLELWVTVYMHTLQNCGVIVACALVPMLA